MDAAQYQLLKKLFEQAQACAPEERAAFLERACGNDDALRRELIKLLARDEVPTGALAPDLPAFASPPEKVGPYRLGRELGSGGMGAVYRATDERDGRTVAVKFLHDFLHLSPNTLDRFLREGALGRQVDHPNVVRTLDVGEVDGRPYLAMEYVEGRSLREMQAQLGTVPERLLREIGAQVARGLAAIHAVGVVHRDLKPENVLVTDDERVRIMDLGIAKIHQATMELTREGQFLGSLPYAAPEQCELADVGPGADQYALGVVLYELATGVNPFRRENPAAALQAHLEFRPEPPAGISPFLAAVILTLLEKNADDRFPDADALAGVLARGEDSAWWMEREAAATRVPVSREAALVGRDAERARLVDAWHACVTGRGGAIWLAGEPGIGKSRMVDALLEVAGGAGHVLYGSFPPEGRLAGLREAVIDHLGRARLETKLGRLLASAPRLVKPFAALLRQEATEESVGLPAIETAFCALLEGLAAERPTLWVIDDLHYAPEEARRVAEALARTARDRRALVVVTARPDLPLAGMAAERIDLRRLGEKEVRRMAAAVLKDEMVADRLAAWLTQRSDGVPFFVLALLRALEEQGFVARNERGEATLVRDPHQFRAPDAVRDLVAVRLAGLEGAGREIADVAAVIGYEFEAELVADVLDRPLVRILQELADIERGTGLIRAFGRLYRFDHHQVQEALYAALPPRLREEYHALLADACERRLPGEPRGRDHYTLARHHLRGSRPAEGLAHLDPAIAYLEQRHLSHEVADLTGLALARPGLVEGEERLALLHRRFDKLNLLGDRRAEKKVLREILDESARAESPVARARAFLAVAGFYGARGRLLPAVRAYDRALGFAEEAQDVARRIVVLTGRATILWRRGRNDEAIRDLEEAIALARERGDDNRVAMALVNLGIIEKDIGLLAQSEERHRDALAIAKRTGNRRIEAYASGNLGLSAWHAGRLDEAKRHMEHCREITVELGDRRVEITSIGNLGLVEFDRGHLDDAARAFRRQEELSRALDDHVNLAHSLIDGAWVRIETGEHGTARRRLAQALALARRQGMPRLEGHALLRTSWIERAEGRIDEAEALAGEARDVFRRAARDIENVAFATLTLGELAAQRGDPDEAERLFRETVEICRDVGFASTRLRALAHLARLGRDAADPAVEEFATLEPQLSWWEKLDVCRSLSAATGDDAWETKADEIRAGLRWPEPEA